MSRVNLLNLVKKRGLFASFVAAPGNSLIYLDIKSLEPHVLAQLSQDRSLMKLYGKGRPPNDVYLFNGANMSLFRDKLLAVYNPDMPTAAAIKLAKQTFPRERDMLKKFSLSVGYGAQAPKIKSEFMLAGYDIRLRDVEGMLSDYWRVYAGVKAFEARLLEEWVANGGWFLNGRGLPVTLPRKYRKDIVNRCVQYTGHTVLQRYILHIANLRRERDVPMVPYLVDLHDSTTWEVKDEYVPQAVQIYKDALVMLNDELAWDVEISGEVKVGKTLADFLGD